MNLKCVKFLLCGICQRNVDNSVTFHGSNATCASLLRYWSYNWVSDFMRNIGVVDVLDFELWWVV